MEKTIGNGENSNKVKQPETNQKISPEELEIIESLFKYPSLEKIFDPEDAPRLPALKSKMTATLEDLERVVRRGAKEDAVKAAKIIAAYQATLKFLDELEAIRQA